jgi:hypothetical protein
MVLSYCAGNGHVQTARPAWPLRSMNAKQPATHWTPPQTPLSGLHPGRWKCNKEENSLVSINEGLKWSPYLMTFISSSHSSWVASSWLNERVVRAKCWFNKWKEPLGPCSVPDVGSQAVFFTDAFHSPDRVMRNLSHRYFKRNGFLVNSISFL